MKTLLNLIVLLILSMLSSCAGSGGESESHIKIFDSGKYPHVIEHDGNFYYLMQAPPPNSIVIRYARTLEELRDNDTLTVMDGNAEGMLDIWSPELSRIGNKWYIYFEADDGNTDNHQIYVLENAGRVPTEGEWTLHGPIMTDPEWNFGIHPSTIVIKDRQYLLWSGWQSRRAETETQCIFIAEMENPWTLKSSRVMISKPEYEWERQWINPDGTRTAYPIFVNENPEPFLSPDGKNIIVGYSASGIWTPYSSLGMLYASTDSDLLDVTSWTKAPEPLFKSKDEDTAMFGISNIAVVTSPDGESKILYQAKRLTDGREESYICLKSIGWDDASLPVFGSPR